MNEIENANHQSHTFGGIDGRCFGCDVRPFSRSAMAEPCDDLW